MSIISNLLGKAAKWYIGTKEKLVDLNQHYQLDGLIDEITIKRDKFGVPHIYGNNKEDVFFAQGFVHAQDRLWQMEIHRRIAYGRLSEFVGEASLSVDRINRTFGFARVAKEDENIYKSHETYSYLEAYSRGVNAFVKSCSKLPVEFQLVNLNFEPWTPLDSLTFARYIQFQMSYGWLHEIERQQLAVAVGEERAAELHIHYPDLNPTVLSKGIETHRVAADGRLEAFKGPFMHPIGGSNNWAVSPNKMVGGHAVLANDPHLTLTMPAIWYENHLVCSEYNTTGVSLPGTPMVIIGHNEHISWGVTLGFADVQDTYIEKSLSQYQFKGEWLPTEIKKEIIKVKGAKDHVEQIVYTHHGPVISDIAEVPNDKLTLCSKALHKSEMIAGFHQLNIAKHWDDFVDGCRQITSPSLNFVYADTDHNIGYWMSGEVPQRQSQKGLTPRKGWTGEHEWTGNIPFESMPHCFNPAAGYVYTCNNKVVNDDYPYDLGKVWMNGYRAKRLKDLFESKDKFTFNDFKDWQLDTFCPPGIELRDFTANFTNQLKLSLNSHETSCLDHFLSWDGQLDVDSIGGCIYQVLKTELFKALIDHTLNEKWQKKLTGKGPHQVGLKLNEFFGHDTTALLRLIKNPESWWTIKAGGQLQLLTKGLKNASVSLQNELGNDVTKWKWGTLHQIVFGHTLSVRKPLDKVFNTGPVSIPGDKDTLFQTAFMPHSPYSGEMSAPSFRQIIDMGDFDKSISILPCGQSGQLKSHHRNDQIEPWLKGIFKPMYWSKKMVDQHTKYQQKLTPLASTNRS